MITWDEKVILMKKNVPCLALWFLGMSWWWERHPKFSKSGHWGILRKLHFSIFSPIFPNWVGLACFKVLFSLYAPQNSPKILHPCITHNHTTLWPLWGHFSTHRGSKRPFWRPWWSLEGLGGPRKAPRGLIWFQMPLVGPSGWVTSISCALAPWGTSTALLGSPKGSPDRYPRFQIEWIFCWIESS